MTSSLRRLRYAAKLMLSGYGYGALAGLAVLMTMLANAEKWELGQANADTVIAVLAVGFSLLLIVPFSSLFGEEMEERAFGLLFTYPSGGFRLLLERIAVAYLLAAVALSLCLLTVHFTLVRLSLEQVWTIVGKVAPACLFLSGLSLLAGLAGRNVLTGLGVGIAYWMFELMTRGAWTGDLHLFQAVWPTRAISASDNGWLLLAAAAVWLIGSFVLMTAGKRRLTTYRD